MHVYVNQLTKDDIAGSVPNTLYMYRVLEVLERDRVLENICRCSIPIHVRHTGMLQYYLRNDYYI